MYALMMMHSDVCVVDDDDERGIGWESWLWKSIPVDVDDAAQ